MSTSTRVGIIGAGAIAMYGHIPGIKKHPHGSVVAVCDTNQPAICEKRGKQIMTSHLD
jgi:predicted dehydrogenase